MTTLCGSGLAAVFGDGNPYNGIEDQRRQAPAEMLKSVGTIYCDGALRGSATHVYTATKTHPSVIVTAAHVLYNRVDGQAFKDCSYRPQNKRLTAIPFAGSIDMAISHYPKIVYINLKMTWHLLH